MLRAAAKNHRHVLPLCDPSLYGEFVEHFEKNDISDAFRLKCATAVFEKTSKYDAAIARFLSGGGNLSLDLAKFQDLRYGENPQQNAAFYVRSGAKPFEQLQGKELSYNNLLDLDAAIRLARAFAEPACVIIKHTNPCGVAQRNTLADSLRAAIDADPVSAFGGIIGANREFDGKSAAIIADMFLEVIVAPSFSKEALLVLQKKKNLRLLLTGELPDPARGGQSLAVIAGGLLVQDRDNGRVTRDQLKCVTKRQPTDQEIADCLFAWTVAKHVKSNAIVYAKDGATAGIGAGQMNRRDSARIAAAKAKEAAETNGWPEPRTMGSAVASDAFFPFADGLLAAVEAGATAVIQPGGSIRDDEVIAAADQAGLAMLFTGMRHFRH